MSATVPFCAPPTAVRLSASPSGSVSLARSVAAETTKSMLNPVVPLSSAGVGASSAPAMLKVMGYPGAIGPPTPSVTGTKMSANTVSPAARALVAARVSSSVKVTVLAAVSSTTAP